MRTRILGVKVDGNSRRAAFDLRLALDAVLDGDGVNGDDAECGEDEQRPLAEHLEDVEGGRRPSAREEEHDKGDERCD